MQSLTPVPPPLSLRLSLPSTIRCQWVSVSVYLSRCTCSFPPSILYLTLDASWAYGKGTTTLVLFAASKRNQPPFSFSCEIRSLHPSDSDRCGGLCWFEVRNAHEVIRLVPSALDCLALWLFFFPVTGKKRLRFTEQSQTRYWTQEEHQRFLRASQMYGDKNYVAISRYVRTRTPKQVGRNDLRRTKTKWMSHYRRLF